MALKSYLARYEKKKKVKFNSNCFRNYPITVEIWGRI